MNIEKATTEFVHLAGITIFEVSIYHYLGWWGVALTMGLIGWLPNWWFIKK